MSACGWNFLGRTRPGPITISHIYCSKTPQKIGQVFNTIAPRSVFCTCWFKEVEAKPVFKCFSLSVALVVCPARPVEKCDVYFVSIERYFQVQLIRCREIDSLECLLLNSLIVNNLKNALFYEEIPKRRFTWLRMESQARESEWNCVWVFGTQNSLMPCRQGALVSSCAI